MTDYSRWLDERGFPGCRQADGTFDGGDTAAIMGTIMALSPGLTELIVKPLPEDCPFDYFYNQPLRHPDRKKWYGQPWQYSRDQLIAMLCGLIGYGIPADLLYKAHRKRWFLTSWNTKRPDGSTNPWPFGDVCGPEVWALWIRRSAPWWGRPVLSVLDVQTLIGAIQWRWFTKASNQLTRNHMLVSLTMRDHQPSLLTPLINRINDFPDLIDRWAKSNEATGEFPTADLFIEKLNRW